MTTAMSPIVKVTPDGLIAQGKPLTFSEQYQTQIMLAAAAFIVLKLLK